MNAMMRSKFVQNTTEKKQVLCMPVDTIPCGYTHGTAEYLAQNNDFAGTVKFIFQPAEEGAPQGEEGGADLMIALRSMPFLVYT